MSTLVIDSLPDALYARLQKLAESHRRSLPQEAVHQLEKAVAADESPTPQQAVPSSYWANRKLLPEYVAAMTGGAFSGGTDSARMISEERDAR